MNPQLLPATARDDVPAWQQTVVAFLAEKERRSGSRRTVEGYARMLWPLLLRVGSPDLVTRAHVLAWAHGIGTSGRVPSSARVGARSGCPTCYRGDVSERVRAGKRRARLIRDEAAAARVEASLIDRSWRFPRLRQRWAARLARAYASHADRTGLPAKHSPRRRRWRGSNGPPPVP